MRLTTLFFAAALAGAALPSRAEACSCLSTDVVQSYRSAGTTFVGRVTGMQRSRTWVVYDVLVLDPIASCLRARSVVQVVTRTNEAACGVRFTAGQRYLLFTDEVFLGGRTRLSTGLCSGNRELSSLTADELAFLDARPTDCGGVAGCANGSQPVSCFADPCTVTAACDPTAACESNFCGGCTAEFYDPWNAAMCTPW